MKNIFTISFLFLMFFASRQGQAQDVFDISTGISNINNQPLLWPAMDDSYEVGFTYNYAYLPNLTILTTPTVYFGAGVLKEWAPCCDNGMQLINFGNCGTFLQIPNLIPPNAGSTALAPARDGIGWAIYPTMFPPATYPYSTVNRIMENWWKTTFNYLCTDGGASCAKPSSQAIASVVLDISHVHTNAGIQKVIVNGTTLPGITIGNSPMVIQIPTNLIVPGQNTIIFVAGQITCYGVNGAYSDIPVIFDMEAKVKINSNNTTVDATGNLKNEFCYGEDVFLDGSNTLGNDYWLDLYYGTPFAQAGPSQHISGKPYFVNVTDVFKNYHTFQANTPYRVKLTVVVPGCGVMTTERDFTFLCCGAPDASFSLNKNGNKIEGKSVSKGTHSWQVFSAPGANGGPYTPLSNFSTPKFSMNSDGFCYYVKHTNTVPGCGSVCAAQSICNYSCEDKKCNIDPPEDMYFNPANNQFSWAPVTGAQSYVIEVNICDPYCCTVGSGGQASVSAPIIIHVAGTTYDWNPALAPEWDGSPTCFSWVLYAICPDGSKSPKTFPYCVGTQCPSAMGRYSAPNTTGILGNSLVTYQSPVLNLFPNPAKENVSIDFSTFHDVDFSITIFDATGGIVKTFTNLNTTEKKSSVKCNTAAFAKGVYLVKISTSDNQVLTKKLIID